MNPLGEIKPFYRVQLAPFRLLSVRYRIRKIVSNDPEVSKFFKRELPVFFWITEPERYISRLKLGDVVQLPLLNYADDETMALQVVDIFGNELLGQSVDLQPVLLRQIGQVKPHPKKHVDEVYPDW